MNDRINIDILGGLSLLAISSFFYFQMSEDFSEFALYFPERILPILAGFGVILLIKGVMRPQKTTKALFQINKTMLAAILTGIFWVILLEYVGFIITSFACMLFLLLLYMPKEERSVKSITINTLGSLVAVIFFYYIFTQYLGVTLPKGILPF